MAIGRGLLQRLASPDPRRRPDLVEAVLVNLTSILNTHEGDGFTCPDMGCDFVDLLSRWPTSESDVLRAVRESIARYETRLSNVQVRRLEDNSTKIELEITGQLKDPEYSRERVKLRTELSRSGQVNVK
ncbi:MAG: type VI secretion system baseplate subunit TssE [Myxococcales bacterium]|nr:type VI secretion system baseplate subunit TssE [Myxococcales bacterium]MCB9717381.1 type VI secretion system baseplate subunit TssE [Myxococcales bacterium]